MATIGNIDIRLGLDLKGLKKGFSQASKGITRFGSTAKRGFAAVGKGVGRLTKMVFSLKGAFLGLGAAVVVNALRRLAFSQLDLIDKTAKLSKRLKVTTEFLSEMRFAAERSGVDFQQLSLGIQRASRRFEEFRQFGTGEAAKALELLGPTIQTAVERGESFESLLPNIANRFQELSGSQKAVLAGFKLFDSEGVSLIQLLQLGSIEIQRLRDRAHDLGLTITQFVAKRAEQLKDSLVDLSGAFQGLGIEIITSAGPAISLLIRSFANFISQNRGKVIEILRLTAVVMLEVAAAIVEVAGALKQMFDEIKGGSSFFDALSNFGKNTPESFRNIITLIEKMRDATSGMNFQGGDRGDFAPEGQGGEDTAQQPGFNIDGFRAKLQSLRETVAENFAAITEEGGNMFEALAVMQDEWLSQGEIAFLTWVDSFKVTTQTILDGIGSVLDTFSSGVGDAFARIIVDGEKASEVFKQLAKQLLKTIIQTIFQIATQALIGAALQAVASAIVGKAKIALWEGVTAAAAYAASVETFGIAGIFAAPGFASLAVAGFETAVKAASAAGAALGGGMVPGARDGAILPGTGATLVSAGEVGNPEAILPLNRIDEFLPGGGRGGMMTLIVNLDGQVLAESTFEHMPGVLNIEGIDVQ